MAHSGMMDLCCKTFYRFRNRCINRTALLAAGGLILATISGNVFAQSSADISSIKLPAGFSIEIWADDVPNARSMALGDNGTVFVATRRDGRIFALVPRRNGSPVVYTLAENLKMPNGIAFHDGDLYVAENHRVIRYADIEKNLSSPPDFEIINDSLPTESHHGWRYIDIGPDGKLYISIGAPCNICDRPGFANISRMDLDGSNQEVVAEGIRNSVGFAWHPDTDELWFTDNGRDMLGDNTPPGELNHITRDGLHFGFPFCHGGDVPDPEFGEQRACDEFTAPVQKLPAHVAPLGLLFYSGSMFPDEYAGQVFIAEHGSWNRTRKIGFRISLVRITDAGPSGYEVFAEGWLQDETSSGRPTDLLVMKDGSMLVSDDQAGIVYRISYARPLDEGVAWLPATHDGEQTDSDVPTR